MHKLLGKNHRKIDSAQIQGKCHAVLVWWPHSWCGDLTAVPTCHLSPSARCSAGHSPIRCLGPWRCCHNGLGEALPGEVSHWSWIPEGQDTIHHPPKKTKYIPRCAHKTAGLTIVIPPRLCWLKCIHYSTAEYPCLSHNYPIWFPIYHRLCQMISLCILKLVRFHSLVLCC